MQIVPIPVDLRVVYRVVVNAKLGDAVRGARVHDGGFETTTVAGGGQGGQVATVGLSFDTYPIGIDKPCTEWKVAGQTASPEDSYIAPASGTITTRLIEPPFTV